MQPLPSFSGTLAPGAVVAGRYRLERHLGRGGMSQVFCATDLQKQSQVAVKILRPDVILKPETIARFQNEAKATIRAAHPNIVAMLDAGVDQATGSLFHVQELLVGEDLRARLDRSRKLPPAVAVHLIAPVMNALAFAHAHGVLHRDIKPGNIFLAQTATGEVPKLIDFGISKSLDEEGFGDATLTRTGTTVGTPHYMSPEQARGERDIDARSDVWAVGVVLYEMLSGKLPYDAPNYNLLVTQLLTKSPPPLEVVAPELPTRLCAVVERALAHERNRRYPDMNAFLTALHQSQVTTLEEEYVPTRAMMPATDPIDTRKLKIQKPSEQAKNDEPDFYKEHLSVRAPFLLALSFGITAIILGAVLGARNARAREELERRAPAPPPSVNLQLPPLPPTPPRVLTDAGSSSVVSPSPPTRPARPVQRRHTSGR